MPLLFMITDKYYEGRISPSITIFLRNPVLIICGGKALVIIAILKSYRNGNSSNFLFAQEMFRTEVNYLFFLHPVV